MSDVEGGVRRTEAAEGEWPEAVSDGLTLPCAVCDEVPQFDYRVKDEFWRSVVPPHMQKGVICLPCLDWAASTAGMDVSKALIEVQFTGSGKTVVLKPERVVIYESDTPKYVHATTPWIDTYHLTRNPRRTMCGRKINDTWRDGKNGSLCQHCERMSR